MTVVAAVVGGALVVLAFALGTVAAWLVVVRAAVVESAGSPDGAGDRDDLVEGFDEVGLPGVVEVVGDANACGQISRNPIEGGSRRPPSCHTHASVEPGAGSWLPAPCVAYVQVDEPFARYQYDQ